ncbi:MAG: hypothetical protein ABI767_00590 [Rhodanobacter sp.]
MIGVFLIAGTAAPIGQHFHVEALLGEAAEVTGAAVTGNEVRRYEPYAMPGAIGNDLDVRPDAQLGLVCLGFDLFGLVGDPGRGTSEPFTGPVSGGDVEILVQDGQRIVGLHKGARVMRELRAQFGQVIVIGMLAERDNRIGLIVIAVFVERV